MRGTDAADISYVHDGKVAIYKRPKAAHKIHFNAPDDSKAIMGHTRFATQGDKKKYYNNHPFAGHADKEFAFAHNSVLYNDNTLRQDKHLPDTHIETDSYIAVQLIEQQGKLDFDSLRNMAEVVHGNFTFTVLDQENSLYIIKGSNPMYLLHFEALGLYIYASTESIMKKALGKTCLGRFNSSKVECSEGDILCIDSSGMITKEEFEPALYRSHFMGWYDDEPYLTCMKNSCSPIVAVTELIPQMWRFFWSMAIPATRSRICLQTISCSMRRCVLSRAKRNTVTVYLKPTNTIIHYGIVSKSTLLGTILF